VKLSSSVSKNITALIVKQKTDKLTGKLAKAEQLGVPIYTVQEFLKMM
jgi:NAD-dependent DNA ligase